MHVVFFSGIPFFRDRVTGGAQKILTEVTRHLGRSGHRVTLLAPERPGCDAPFELGPGVTVRPTLPVQRFPQICDAPPYHLAALIAETQRALAGADRLFVLDAVLPFHFLYDDLPVVQSFHNFSYSDTFASGLCFRRDRLLLNSDYVRGCVRDTFAEFCPAVLSRCDVVPNGFDLDFFRPLPPDAPEARRLRDLVALPEDAIPVLYPHRPDPHKGLYEAVEAIARLRQRWGGRGDRLRLLVPRWSDGAAANDSDAYDRLREFARDRDAEDLLHLHPWIPAALMPAYYALGRAAFCLGTVPETFGNVPVESLACGTPAIVARVAAYRSVLPESLVAKVDPGDAIAATDALEAILDGSPFDPAPVRAYLADRYGLGQMLAGYERVLAAAERRPPLRETYGPPLRDGDRLYAPAWCYRGAKGYYNDYRADYARVGEAAPEENRALLHLLERADLPVSVAEARAAGLSLADLEALRRSGWLVRRFPPTAIGAAAL